MAHPIRSMNDELKNGSTDGKFKKNVPDTSLPDSTNAERRTDMAWPFGFYQAPVMETPDGKFYFPKS